ncbi:molybdate transporter 1-like [Forsythia ovata]|uniref:Molybdate transporter 1-like n=1 Tax=Forsythia ovata TaxID=205694 RepID=A0ABD1SNG9_9LAMI
MSKDTITFYEANFGRTVGDDSSEVCLRRSGQRSDVEQFDHQRSNVQWNMLMGYTEKMHTIRRAENSTNCMTIRVIWIMQHYTRFFKALDEEEKLETLARFWSILTHAGQTGYERNEGFVKNFGVAKLVLGLVKDFGVAKLVLGLVLGSSLVKILDQFSVGILGVLLLFAEIKLAMCSRDMNSKKDGDEYNFINDEDEDNEDDDDNDEGDDEGEVEASDTETDYDSVEYDDDADRSNDSDYE